jgi:alkylation response protein AidB-like acyl-CoA dehydrogenase
MTEMVQVALADDATEAEEIQALLEDAGIASAIAPDDDSDSLKVLVPEDAVEAAQDVIELAPTEEESTPEV